MVAAVFSEQGFSLPPIPNLHICTFKAKYYKPMTSFTDPETYENIIKKEAPRH